MKMLINVAESVVADALRGMAAAHPELTVDVENRVVVRRDAPAVTGIPCTLGQGSPDPGNLLRIVWRLHHAWPGSELVLVDDVGHDAGAPDLAEA
ncbi:hypothetical protein PV421_39205, partial [Streptomyces scabiei]|nr:hypothetical protein [Streptomyces scabiei]